MTIAEIIKDAKKSTWSNDATISKIIAVAYWMGREESARRICDKSSETIKSMVERAKKCRYHQMALGVVGDVRMIYDGDYAGDVSSTFGCDEVPAEIERLIKGE